MWVRNHLVWFVAAGISSLLASGCAGSHGSREFVAAPAPLKMGTDSRPSEKTPRIKHVQGHLSPFSAELASHDASVADAPTVQNASAAQPVMEEPLLEQPAVEQSVVAPLALTQLEEIALANNPTLAQAQAKVDVVRGRWVQAGLPPNPVIGYVGEEIGVEGAAGQHGALIGQTFITGGKLSLSQQIVAQEIEQASQQWVAQRSRVLTDVRRAYNSVLIAERRIAVTHNILETATQAVNTIEELLAGMQATRIALLQAEVEAEAARILQVNAGNEHQAAWRRLVAVAGTPGMPAAALAGDVTELPPPLDWDASLARLQTDSPEVAAALAAIDRADWVLERAYAETTPNIDVQLGVRYGDLSQDTLSTVQVAMPLRLWNRNQGAICAAQAEVTAAERDADRLDLDLQRRLAGVYRQYVNARQQANRYAVSLLPKAEETLKLVSIGYQAGEVDYLTLLTAQRTYYQTNLAYLNALRQVWAAYVEIEGLLLSNSLESR